MQKTSKTKIDISVEEVALYEESIKNGMWEHLAGYSIEDIDPKTGELISETSQQ